jgi:hypothetical protein
MAKNPQRRTKGAERQKAGGDTAGELLKGALLFAIPGGGFIRVAAVGGKLAAAAARKIAQLGAKRVAKPTAQQVSKAKPLGQVKLPAPKAQGPGTSVAKSQARQKPASKQVIEGKAVEKSAPKAGGAGQSAAKSRAVQKKPKSEVKKPGTSVTQTRVIKDKPKGMKTVRGTDTTRKPPSLPKSKPKKPSRAKQIAAGVAIVGGAGVLGKVLGGKDDKAAAGGAGKSKVTPPARSPKRGKSGDMSDRQKQRQVPKSTKKPKPSTNRDKDGLKKRTTPPLGGASDKRTNITAGKNTGFGPKGNIFPSDAADRKRLMDLYGGTGSAAAKAAARGTQGSLKRKKK